MPRYQIETFFTTGDSLAEMKDKINLFLSEKEHDIKKVVDIKYQMQEDDHDFYFSAMILYIQKRKRFFSQVLAKSN